MYKKIRGSHHHDQNMPALTINWCIISITRISTEHIQHQHQPKPSHHPPPPHRMNYIIFSLISSRTNHAAQMQEEKKIIQFQFLPAHSCIPRTTSRAACQGPSLPIECHKTLLLVYTTFLSPPLSQCSLFVTLATNQAPQLGQLLMSSLRTRFARAGQGEE